MALSDSIIYALQEAADALEERMGPIVADAGLTLPQFNLLYHVIESGPARVSDLARYRRCVKSNVSNLVRTMEARNLVEILAAPGDGRARLVAATAAGRKRFLKARRAAARMDKKLHRALGSSDGRLLARLSLSAAEFFDDER